jgi:hypothetical protein
LVRLPDADRSVWPGAIVGGVGWTILQSIGALLVNHQLRHLSNLYGTFATVLGLIWWIALGSMVTVYAAEFNVVLTRHLWPRSLRSTRPRSGDGDEEASDHAPAGSLVVPEVAARPGSAQLEMLRSRLQALVGQPGVRVVGQPDHRFG